MRKPQYNITSLAEKNLSKIGFVIADNDRPKEECDKLLSDYSTKSHYDDDEWFIDKTETKMNFADFKRTFRFDALNRKPIIQEALKQWTLNKLMSGRNITGIKNAVTRLTKDFLMVYGDKELSEIDADDIRDIYEKIIDTNGQPSTIFMRWQELKNFFYDKGLRQQMIYMENYVLEPARPKKSAEKYIPGEVADIMDRQFMTDMFPFVYRVFYWCVRLFPNRLEEIVSLKDDCIKKIGDNRYLLTVPTLKMSGNFSEPAEKHFEIIYEDIGKFLVDLLLEQQKFAMEHPDENHFLFRSYTYEFVKSSNTFRLSKRFKDIRTYSSSQFINFFSHLGKRFNYYDDNNHPVNITTHRFRHNAITDRRISKIFRDIDIMYEAGHHSLSMINNNYSHRETPEKSKDFRGRIIEAEARMNRLLQNPYSHRLFGLGVCTDSRDCENDPAKCLRCEYFKPKKEFLPFYENDLSMWKSRKEKAEKVGNKDYVKLCGTWIDSYQAVLDRLENDNE